MLAEINIWLDITAVAIIAFGAGFWIFQIIGNLATGRFKNKFIGKEWPHHDQVISTSLKILHAGLIINMIALGITGLYMRFPFFLGGRETMKIIHLVFAFTVLANFALRLYYAFVKDSDEFRITVKEISSAPKVLLYYMFIGRSYPRFAKYNILQKVTYGAVFPGLIVMQTYTGFALMWPTILLGPFADFVGGIAMAAAWSRVIHYFSAIMFLMLTIIHVCLTFVEDFPALLVFFGLAKQEVHRHGDHDIEESHLQIEPAEA